MKIDFEQNLCFILFIFGGQTTKNNYQLGKKRRNKGKPFWYKYTLLTLIKVPALIRPAYFPKIM